MRKKVIQAIPALAKGKLYHLSSRGYPAMIRGDKLIQGYLLLFADTKILSELDELEDYHSQRSPEKNEYQRQLISVYDLSRNLLGKAWVYLMDIEKVKQLQGTFIPSGHWSEVPRE